MYENSQFFLHAAVVLLAILLVLACIILYKVCQAVNLLSRQTACLEWDRSLRMSLAGPPPHFGVAPR
jgi:hypothetical protein